MTNETALLAVLNGMAALKDGATFHPQTHEQAYLAYAVGLLTDLDALPAPQTPEEALLREYCVNGGGGGGGGGGIDLPTLDNPAIAAFILAGYDAIDQNGKKLTGTMKAIEGEEYVLDPANDTFIVEQGYHDGTTEVLVNSCGIIVTPSSEEQVIEAGEAFFKTVTVEPAPGAGETLKIKAEGLTTALTTSSSESKSKGIFAHWMAPKLDLRAFDASGFTSLQSAFHYNSTVQSLDVTGWDTSNVTSLVSTFHGCSALTEIKGLNTWDTSKVTSLGNTFNGCHLTDITSIENLDTSSVTVMSSTFGSFGTTGMHMDLTRWSTGKVTAMNNMFAYCSVQSIDITGWDTSNVTTMEYMFNSIQCDTITGLETLNVSKLTNANRMFYNSKNLKSVNITGWKFGASSVNLPDMFGGCTALETVYGLDTLNTENVTSTQSMFSGCTSLKGTLSFSSWDTSKISSMASMFYNCYNLERIYGFSATSRAGLGIAFPNGNSTYNANLQKLTFRTDIDNAIRSAINIQRCRFDRTGMAEMFRTLTDVTDLGLSSSYTTITITGNPCVSSTIKIREKNNIPVGSYIEFASLADEFYYGFDRTGAQIKGFVDGVGWETANVTDVTMNNFNYSVVSFLTFTATVPENMKLTDEDRAIATSKGWTLVE